MSLRGADEAAEARLLSAPRNAVVHLWLTAEVAGELSKAAERRGTHPDRLAALLLTIILGDGLVDAIIDR